MRKRIFQWLGNEFIALSCEGKQRGTAAEEAREIFRRLDEELRGQGLSLDHTVRTRLWARDRESRNQASNERFKLLSGKARSVSSSYIAPDHFDSDARVAMDLLAMRPVQSRSEKALVEYDPPIVPLRYLTYDSMVFLSGVTVVLPELATQLRDILPRITGSLADAGASWNQVVKVSSFLHRSQRLETYKELFAKDVKAEIPLTEYAFVDGYSSEGKLVEVEVTARLT
jgi:enamine deaminase RidA (YjgF/YER057c/UK114 family)